MKYQTTGSDSWNNTPAICFVDGITASQQYGVELRKSDGCPNCHGPVDTLLSFNPSSGYYYLAPCPICGQFVLYCDVNGNLVSKFEVVKSSKVTEIDQNFEVEDRYDY